MPCRSEGGSAVYIRNPIDKDLEIMLCSACRGLERLGYDFDENPKLATWWHQHKLEDEKRVREEQKKALREKLAIELTKKPVSKLTKEDMVILREEGFL